MGKKKGKGKEKEPVPKFVVLVLPKKQSKRGRFYLQGWH